MQVYKYRLNMEKTDPRQQSEAISKNVQQLYSFSFLVLLLLLPIHWPIHRLHHCPKSNHIKFHLDPVLATTNPTGDHPTSHKHTHKNTNSLSLSLCLPRTRTLSHCEERSLESRQGKSCIFDSRRFVALFFFFCDYLDETAEIGHTHKEFACLSPVDVRQGLSTAQQTNDLETTNAFLVGDHRDVRGANHDVIEMKQNWIPFGGSSGPPWSMSKTTTTDRPASV